MATQPTQDPPPSHAARPPGVAPATLLAHAGREIDAVGNAPVAPPLYQSVVYRFDSVAQLEAIYAGAQPGYFYYRYGTPNHALLERTIAALEGAEAAVATASGMAALAATVLAHAGPGEHLVADRHVYGGTHTLLTEDLPRLGIHTTFVDLSQPDALDGLASPRPRWLVLETLTNPTLHVTDLPRWCAAAHERGLRVIVDSTFTTPYLVQPLSHGADLVWHATSKYVGGQSQALGGIVVGPRELVEPIRETVTHLGMIGGPFDAWLAAQGLATLALRMERACANAAAIAAHLAGRPDVRRVLYPGLPTHPGHALAKTLYRQGFGAMLGFEVVGGERFARGLLERLRLIEFVPSLADVRTTISYPVATSHRRLSPEALSAMGVASDLVRLSVGIEAVQDVIADLDQALDACSQEAPARAAR